MPSRKLASWLVVVLALVAPALVGATGAQADPPTDASLVARAIDGLSQNPPVFSDPNAPLHLSPAEVLQVQDAIAAAETPIYVAILPGRAGKALPVSREMRDAIRQPGAYVAVSGESYAATSDVFEVEDLMQEAFTTKRNYGTAEVLVRFAQLVGARAHGQVPERPAMPWLTAGIIVAVALVGAFSYGAFMRRRAAKTPESPDCR